VEDEGGTAGRLKALNLKIAGKTGTAQVVKLDRSGVKGNIPYNMRFHAWFVGFAPHDDPEIVVCALVEHGGMGGVEAVPVAYKVFEAYLAPEKQPLIEKVENQ
jgi:penicillin-binding protein 2